MTKRLEFLGEPGGKTRLINTQGPYTNAAEPMARQGWESSFAKLEPLLAR